MIELLKSFKKRQEIEVELVLFSEVISYPEIIDFGFTIHMLERKPKKDPRVFFHFYKLCKRFKPDIIHSWGTMSSIYAIPASKWLGIILINGNVVDAPKDLSIFDKRFFRAKLTFPFSDVILGNSQAGLRAYRAPKSKSRCIYNGFDLDRAKKLEDSQAVRERFNIPFGQIVGMVGAFYDRKDYDTFIKAAIRLLNQHQKASFLAIGDGPNLERCKSLIPYEYRERILFLGQIDKIESLVNVFNIGVLATNTAVHGEGISNSIMEYMVLGKPVVATNGGGTPEIVTDGETGFLVEPMSPSHMAEKIGELLDRPEMAKEMGIRGENLIKTDFSLERMESEYLELYQTLNVDRTVVA